MALFGSNHQKYNGQNIVAKASWLSHNFKANGQVCCLRLLASFIICSVQYHVAGWVVHGMRPLVYKNDMMIYILFFKKIKIAIPTSTLPNEDTAPLPTQELTTSGTINNEPNNVLITANALLVVLTILLAYY